MVAREIEALVTARKIEVLEKIGVPEAARRVLEEHVTRVEAIRAEMYQPGKSAELEKEAFEDTRKKFSLLTDQLLVEAEKPFVQEEGRILASIKGTFAREKPVTTDEKFMRLIDVTEEARRTTVLSMDLAAIAVSGVDAVLDLVEGAFLSERAEEIARITAAAERRLEELERTDRARNRRTQNYVSSISGRLRQLRNRASDWRAEHPTPAARLRALRQRRDEEVGHLRTALQKATLVMQLDEKSIRQHGRTLKKAQPVADFGGVTMGRRFNR